MKKSHEFRFDDHEETNILKISITTMVIQENLGHIQVQMLLQPSITVQWFTWIWWSGKRSGSHGRTAQIKRLGKLQPFLLSRE